MHHNATPDDVPCRVPSDRRVLAGHVFHVPCRVMRDFPSVPDMRPDRALGAFDPRLLDGMGDMLGCRVP